MEVTVKHPKDWPQHPPIVPVKYHAFWRNAGVSDSAKPEDIRSYRSLAEGCEEMVKPYKCVVEAAYIQWGYKGKQYVLKRIEPGKYEAVKLKWNSMDRVYLEDHFRPGKPYVHVGKDWPEYMAAGDLTYHVYGERFGYMTIHKKNPVADRRPWLHFGNACERYYHMFRAEEVYGVLKDGDTSYIIKRRKDGRYWPAELPAKYAEHTRRVA